MSHINKCSWANLILKEVNKRRKKKGLNDIPIISFGKMTKDEILNYVGISKSMAYSFFITDEQKDKRKKYSKKYRQKLSEQENYFLKSKISIFKTRSSFNKDFDYLDVINKFGDNPKCYLTGLPIDYNDGKSYQLDHFIPVAKGGTSDLDNMKLANPMANEMKRDYELSKFLEICRLITENNKVI